MFAVFSTARRPLGEHLDGRVHARRFADRQGVHRAVAHVAARRLLRGRAAAARLLLLPGRQRGRRARRRHHRRLHRRDVQLAGAVLRLRDPDRAARARGRDAARAAPRRAGEEARGRRHRDEPRPRKRRRRSPKAWRMCWQIDSLRRIYRVLPFLTPAVAGFAIFSTFLYRDVFGLDDSARGWVLGLVEGPAQLVGLTVGARLGMKLLRQGPEARVRAAVEGRSSSSAAPCSCSRGRRSCGSRSRPTS